MAPYTMNVTTLAAVNWAEENRLSGSIGAGERLSQTAKATSRRMPQASAASTGPLPQPLAGPWISP
jgi:hypothetical protein